MTNPLKCLVTGAAGFIGSHLVDRLLERGATVVGLDNLKLGRLANLKSALKHPQFRFYEADVTDDPSCRKVLAEVSQKQPVDEAWHMAANSDIRAGLANPDIDLNDTFLTTYHLLKLMREFRIARIAFASTSAIYGEHLGRMMESTGPLLPISNYGAMKLASEAAISAATEAFLQRSWIFRFPNVVGNRSTHGVIYDFAQKLKKNPTELEVLGDGQQEKPYFHVADLLDAMLFIHDNGNDKLNYFNIGPAGSATTVRYIAEAVIQEMSPAARIHYTGGSKGWVGDVAKFNYSVDKLNALGWQPKLASNQAVDRAVREIVAEARE